MLADNKALKKQARRAQESDDRSSSASISATASPSTAGASSRPTLIRTRNTRLLVHVYGEPAGQTVLDRWGGGNNLWHRMLAQKGYVVMSFDNRGTPAPRGRAWRKSVFRQIGILAPRTRPRP